MSADPKPPPNPQTSPDTPPPAACVTPTDLARIVVRNGWATSMTRQRVMQLADTDPDWPVPRTEWHRVGAYWQIPLDDRLKDYFTNRTNRPGPKGWT
ncbi:hypothetical protein ACFYXM_11390 [Streptomyces sp. NPDC002476]|uniref:hypothetical protein n=1 Tax=Streptomyces sp. NPDC002476 TaxID=3364648 RepID=UPI0036C9AC4C